VEVRSSEVKLNPKLVLGYLILVLGAMTAFCSLPVFALAVQRSSATAYASVSESCQNGALMGGVGFLLVALGIVGIGFAMVKHAVPELPQRVPFGFVGFNAFLVGFYPAFVGLNRGLECVWGS
jgi:hypothetical protein